MDDPIDVFAPHWYVGAADLLRTFTAQQRARMDEGLREIAAAGAQISLTDYPTAVRRRAELGTAMRRFHENYDLLLTPTCRSPRSRRPERLTQRASRAGLIGRCSQSVQPDAATGGLRAVRTDHCRPAGGPADRRGPMHADALVLRAARAFEAARSRLRRPPRDAGQLNALADRRQPLIDLSKSEGKNCVSRCFFRFWRRLSLRRGSNRGTASAAASCRSATAGRDRAARRSGRR